MKKLAILLVICLLLQSFAVAAFAENEVDLTPVDPTAAVGTDADETVPAENDAGETPAAEIPADDGAEVPADDAEIPADDAEIPADDAEIPADDAEIPADDAEIPADDAEIPADDAEVPADDADVPADDGAEVPADDAEVPADDAEIPADDAEEPADGEDGEEADEDEAEEFAPTLVRLSEQAALYADAGLSELIAELAAETVVYACEKQEDVFRVQYAEDGEAHDAFVSGAFVTPLSEEEAAAWQAQEHSEEAVAVEGWYLEPVLFSYSEEAPEDDEELTSYAIDDFVVVGGVLMEYKGTVKSVTVPNTVSKINAYCFSQHTEIESITLPDTVTEIGEGAFFGCTRLLGVSLPSGVTKLEPNTFKNCSALTNVTWSQITEIGDNCFENCSNLRGVALPSSLKVIHDHAFFNCKLITAVDFPASLEAIYDNAFANCSGLASVALDGCTSLTKLGGLAFANCSALNSLTLPASLPEIDNFAFQNCVSLKTLQLPNGLVKIDREAFSGCRSLSIVTIPASVDQILTQAFQGVAAGCTFIMEGHPSLMGQNCIPRGSFIFGESDPSQHPELYANNNGVTFYRIQIVRFVERCYSKLLGRYGDLQGIVDWSKALGTHSLTGATVVSGFANSAEFAARGLSYDDTIEALYQTMQNRSVDSTGLATWKGYLENGASLNYIINGIAGSNEFSNPITGICAQYGIEAGSIPVSEWRDVNLNITAFVARCYLNVLNRPFDAAGLNSWCENIINKGWTGARVIDAFMLSPEMAARGLSYDDQVEILYNTMLDRPSDTTGKTMWLNYLNNAGVSIRNVEEGFAGSREFRLLCRTYGMNPGSVPSLEPRDQNREVSRFVMDCFRWSYAPGEYEPTTYEINYFTQLILTRQQTPAQTAYNFVFSRDCVERGLTNDQFMIMLYHIYLGRQTDPTAAELSPWVGRLTTGASTREQVAAAFAQSAEYFNYCRLMGLQ